MYAHISIAALSVCLLLVALTAIGKEGEEERQNEAEELERARHELKLDPGETPEGPAKRNPREHIDEHLRTQELLERHPVEIPDRFEKKK